MGHPLEILKIYSYNKAHGANMGPTWGLQDPGWSHVGPINLAIWVLEPLSHQYVGLNTFIQIFTSITEILL